MRITSTTPQALLIPLFALLATFALGMTPWGESFSTIPGYSKEERIAHIALTGFLKPKVAMGIAESEKGMWVRMTVEGVEGVGSVEGGEGVKVEVPVTWHL